MFFFTVYYSPFTCGYSSQNCPVNNNRQIWVWRVAAKLNLVRKSGNLEKPSPMIRGKGDRLRWKRVDLKKKQFNFTLGFEGSQPSSVSPIQTDEIYNIVPEIYNSKTHLHFKEPPSPRWKDPLAGGSVYLGGRLGCVSSFHRSYIVSKLPDKPEFELYTIKLPAKAKS